MAREERRHIFELSQIVYTVLLRQKKRIASKDIAKEAYINVESTKYIIDIIPFIQSQRKLVFGKEKRAGYYYWEIYLKKDTDNITTMNKKEKLIRSDFGSRLTNLEIVSLIFGILSYEDEPISMEKLSDQTGMGRKMLIGWLTFIETVQSWKIWQVDIERKIYLK